MTATLTHPFRSAWALLRAIYLRKLIQSADFDADMHTIQSDIELRRAEIARKHAGALRCELAALTGEM